MELKSTATFKDVDIDAMLEHTTFDEFMRGLYTSRVAQSSSPSSALPQMTEFDSMMQQVFADDASEVDAKANLKLQFKRVGQQDGDEDTVERDSFFGQNMEAQAIANVRERRQRRE